MSQEDNIREISIKSVNINVYTVRSEMNSRWVERLKGLYLSHADIPPLIISRSKLPELNGHLLDGRHRYAALFQLERTEILVVYEDVKNEADLIEKAIRYNRSDRLTPNDDDIKHQIRLLRGKGMSRPVIVRMTSDGNGLPYSYVDRIYFQQTTDDTKRKLAAMRNDILEHGMSLPDAMKRNGLSNKDQAKNFIKPKKNGKDKDESDGIVSLERIKSALKTSYNKYEAVGSRELRIVKSWFLDGKIPSSFVTKVLDYMDSLDKNLSNVQENRRIRIINEISPTPIK